MLEIARGIDGRVRLVTTNFDLLFEACDPTLLRTAPPRLPDPARFNDLAGVIHLHGHVTDDYSGAAGDGFVLSSASFGRAYLSEAWATNFFRSVLGKYCVLFLGYGADDLPVQYLLEALNRSAGSSGEIYAFQSGTDNEAAAIWEHRGVKSISYNEADNHAALWATLEAWAIRSKDPKAWVESVIDAAHAGPEALPPHMRGQVAHIVSTREGARQFASAQPPPPGTWLYVFDPCVRYLQPYKIDSPGEDGAYFDPFDFYGLDSDPVPQKLKADDHRTQREIPQHAWDGLIPIQLDLENIQGESYFQLRGHWASNVPSLLPRLRFLGAWIAKVAHQPETVWWAAGQTGLHPDIQFCIQSHFGQNKSPKAGECRRAWRYLFEYWNSQFNALHLNGLIFLDTTALDGWSSAIVREYARLHKPYLEVMRSGRNVPGTSETDPTHWGKLVNVNIEYPVAPAGITVPDDHLAQTVKELRSGLELAVTLENELGGYRFHRIPPFERDPDLVEERIIIRSYS